MRDAAATKHNARTLERVLVSAPASSANLGPGFDCLAIALGIPFWLDARDPGDEPQDPPQLPQSVLEGDVPVPMLAAEASHPAALAFEAAGGAAGSSLWWRSTIPPGRGQGFSGASRVAGAFAAFRLAGVPPDRARRAARNVAAELEGHPDNAAASALGALSVSAGDTDVRLDVPGGVEVALWWPDESQGTDASRQALAEVVELTDATHNVSRAALWVAAIATGDLAALRWASEDRLHQQARLDAMAQSAAALEAFLDDGSVWAAWLSGSGPTVAALVPAGYQVPAGLPEGRTAVVAIDTEGVREAN